ncbi:MAG: ImmA/IrrE family metallo-endopeptidase [Armatimonadota bacterium]
MDPFDIYNAIKIRVQRLHADMDCVLPIDVKAIAKYLNIQYTERLLKQDLDGIYLLSKNGSAHIYINNHPSKSAGRKRFSACHEIMHHLIASEMGLKDALCTDTPQNQDDAIERLCNKGAGMLLMPEDQVRTSVKELRIYARANVLQSMSHIYGVTPSAAKVRLEELGMIDQITNRTRKW